MFRKSKNSNYLKFPNNIWSTFLHAPLHQIAFSRLNGIKKILGRDPFGITRIIVLSILLLFYNYDYLFAQDSSYKINKKDLLELTFWEYPEMNAQVRVNSEGTVSLPLIGNIKVEGLTIVELSQKIITQMGIYNKIINQVNIKVLEYGHNKVVITGSIVSPGKYYFEEIPNLWDIITEAGGPLEDARLDEVLIIRNQDEGTVITAEVATALKQGKLQELPKIFSGDAIYITGNSSPFKFSKHRLNLNEFYIMGAVGSPGTQQFVKDLNILDAIGRAGGPTSDANLSEVKYIAVYDEGTDVRKINLKSYLNNSQSEPLPLVDPGSTIFVPRKMGLSPFLTTVITTAVVSAITAYIYVSVR